MNETKYYNTLQNEELSFKDLIYKIQEWYRFLLKKWPLILLISSIGAASGFIYSLYSKSIYTATTTFVLEDEKGAGGLGGLSGLASVAGIDLNGTGGGIFQGDNILTLYKSRRIIEKTLLTKTNINGKPTVLIDRYIDFNNLRKKWASNSRLVNLNFHSSIEGLDDKKSRLRDSILGVIVFDINKNYLTVSKPDKKLSTIEVDVKAEDELFAKTFNEELVRNVNEFYVQTKTKKSLQNINILQHKVDSVKMVMNGAIYSAVAIADATPNLNPTKQVQRVVPAQRAQFSAEANKAILGNLMQNLELTKVSLLKETPLIQVVDVPVYPLQKTKFGKFKGIILGGLLFGFITCFFLFVNRFLSLVLRN